MEYFPEIVQVIPYEDFTVSVYFSDGKIVLYDVKPFIHTEIFSKISDINIFMESCTILNDTLAWDIAGDRNESECIDIDLDTLYSLPESVEIKTAAIHGDITLAEIAKKVGMSPQSFSNRMKTGKFTRKELDEIGKALGAEFISFFRFPDGSEY